MPELDPFTSFETARNRLRELLAAHGADAAQWPADARADWTAAIVGARGGDGPAGPAALETAMEELESLPADPEADALAAVLDSLRLPPGPLAPMTLPEPPVPARQWLATAGGYTDRGLIPAGRVSALTGTGGAGKSRFALQLAAAVASGEPAFLDPDGGRGPMVALADPAPCALATWEDDAPEVARRLDALGDRPPLFRGFDLATAGPLWEPQSTGTGAHAASLGDWSPAWWRLSEAVEDARCRLLIVDPVAAAFALPENDRRHVRSFLSRLDAWARSTDCAVLLIAHPPKGEGAATGYSGSTDWQAGVRSLLTLDRCVEADGGARPPKRTGKGAADEQAAATWALRHLKSNYGRAADPVWLDRETMPGVWRLAVAQDDRPDP